MKPLRKGLLFGLVLLLLVGAAQQAGATQKALAVPLRVQEQNQWCWAGCSSAVMSYYTKKISQCYIANFGWTRKDCCTTPANCNAPNSMYSEAGSIQGILKHWCVGSSGVASALTFAQCQQQINAERPFIIRYGWDSGGGHFIVVRGYKTDTPGWLFLMNPWPGEGYGTFKYAHVKRVVSDHTWTHTLTTKRNRQAADWKVANTTPIKSGDYWNYNLSINESSGGCGKIVRMYHDFYDEDNVFYHRQENTAQDFVGWFDDCADKDIQLPRKTKFCGDTWTSLGGSPSGYIKHFFVIKCDSGASITRSKKITLPGDDGDAGMVPEAQGKPATGPLEATDSPAAP